MFSFQPESCFEDSKCGETFRFALHSQRFLNPWINHVGSSEMENNKPGTEVLNSLLPTDLVGDALRNRLGLTELGER